MNLEPRRQPFQGTPNLFMQTMGFTVFVCTVFRNGHLPFDSDCSRYSVLLRPQIIHCKVL